ncbi:MAG: hypothetical protein GC208_10315 [Alphaproteobacteria bacterium]|nr:hypothetical protein [Alphaproteobacteria bacterium]
MDILTISNLAAARALDGVYVFEITPNGYVREDGEQVVAVVGDFEMGPVDTVLSIGSAKEFARKLGGYGSAPSGGEDSWRGYSGFRALSGKQWPGLRAVRASRTGMAQATVRIPVVSSVADPAADGVDLVVKAKWKGNYGNSIRVTSSAASDSSLDDGFKIVANFRDRNETWDNLTPGMSSAEIAAINNASELIEVSFEDNDDTIKGAWPLTSALSGGSDGTPLLVSWTNALTLLAARREVKLMFTAEPDGTTVTWSALNAHIKSLLTGNGAAPFKMAIVSGPEDQEEGAVASAMADLRSDRIVYAWPWRRQNFPDASPLHQDGKLSVPANAAVACALANIDPVYDPASIYGTRFINACTTGLEFEDLSRDDYVSANSHGICALEFDPDTGYRVVNGVTTSLQAGLEPIHRRRLADFFLTSIARALKPYQNLPITKSWKDDIVGVITDFLETQMRDISGIPARLLGYELDIVNVNDSASEAQGVFNILLRCRIPASARSIVLLGEIGTNVRVAVLEQDAA